MKPWVLVYENKEDAEGFDEWWTVTNTEMSFVSHNHEHAMWLLISLQNQQKGFIEKSNIYLQPNPNDLLHGDNTP